jgi:hypothetical protein
VLLLVLVSGDRLAHAQDAPPAVTQDQSQARDDTAQALAALGGTLGGLTKGFDQLPERIASVLWDLTGGRVLKAFAAILGFFLAVAGALAHGALGGVNFFTQIPEPWVTLEAIGGMQARLGRLALAVGGLAAALLLLRWVCGLAFGWAFPGWAAAVVKLAALVPLVGAAPAAILALYHAGNVLASALFDPAGGLPGLAAAGGVDLTDRWAAEGAAALFYFLVLLALWWVRVQVVIAALLLFVFAPLAIACWVLPFAVPQWIARAWATLLVGVVAVQVLQAVTLGAGAALLAANVVPGHVEGIGAGALNLALAAALVGATCYVPRRVLGALVAHAPPGYGWAARGLQAGLMLAGAGWLPGMAGAAGVAGRAFTPKARVVDPALPEGPIVTPPPPSGRVGSLLAAGGRPLLPPPTD